MAKVGDITINLSFDDKSKLRLRAIAKHAEALADELDAIDTMDDEDFKKLESKAISIGITSNKNAEEVAEALKDFPTRLEGSE